VIDLHTPRRLLALVALAALVSACSGGGTSPKVTPTMTPTVSPSSTPTGGSSTDAYTCPTSDTDTVTASSSVGGVAAFAASRRKPNAGPRTPPITPGRLAVTYSLSTLTTSRAALVSRESALGTRAIAEVDHTHLGTATRLLSVPERSMASVEASLRSQPGVRSVAVAGYHHYPQTITKPYFTSDPYFTGFAHPVAVQGSPVVPPATYEVGPYEEGPSVPGQWNMHVIGLEDAFAYSQENNGSTVVNGKALGSSSVKIAIIDTGVEATHPELSSKVVYQKCFITNPSNVQSTSNFTTDENGHGTDVAGIAAAATNNGLGFAASGGAASIYAYRIGPTPDDNCLDDTLAESDSQCTIESRDIADAIEDAVAQNVDVINLSLGAGSSAGSAGCSNGQDDDPVEGPAIADAIAANIVVVAAAGNGDPDGTQGVESPACDSGVIAVGATSLADGQLNGTKTSSGSSSSPNEYVSSYSDYGSPAASLQNSNAWGIVAPGGDPSDVADGDPDDLHWITDIYTTTPLDSNYDGDCSDYPSDNSSTDCNIEIAGTSMASPTVAGAAALIIAVNASYKSPTKMKQLLCSTADDIGDSKEGCGRLNVYRAMATAVGDRSLP
jgi:subtilisin family serine protease